MIIATQSATRALGNAGVRHVRQEEGIEISFPVTEPSPEEGVPDPCLVIEALRGVIGSAATLAQLQQGALLDDERKVTVTIPPTIRVTCIKPENWEEDTAPTTNFFNKDELRVLCEALVKNLDVTQNELFDKQFLNLGSAVAETAPRIQELLGSGAFHDLVLRAGNGSSSAFSGNRIETVEEREQESARMVLIKIAGLLKFRKITPTLS